MSRKLFMSVFVLFAVVSLLLFGCQKDLPTVNFDALNGEWIVVADVNNGVVTFKDDVSIIFDEKTCTYNNQSYEYDIHGNQINLQDLGTYQIEKEGDYSLRLYKEKGSYLQLMKGSRQDIELKGQYHVNYRVSEEMIDEDVKFNEVFKDYRNNELFVEASYTNKDQLLTIQDLNLSFYTYAYEDVILLVECETAYVWELVK